MPAPVAASAVVSTADGDILPADAVEVGRVLGAWGIKGGIRVKPFAADPQALFSSKRWFIQPSDMPRPPGAKPGGSTFKLPTLLRVMQAREQGDAVVATAHELPDRDAAEAMKGARIFISRASFPTPDANEFYWVDLIGLAVVNADGAALGDVVGLLETGPHCVLRVAKAGGAEADEVLIPFVDAYVHGVDLPGRRITVDWSSDY